MRARPELCILFLHHRDDAVTRDNYARVRRSNPDAVIVPLCDEPESSLPGAIDVSRFPSEWDTRDKWAGVDSVVYRWFPHRTVEADRYMFFEYDVRCDVDLRAHLAPFWHADVIAARYFDPRENPSWHWFAQRPFMTPEDAPHASGITPLATTILAHDALARVVDVVAPGPFFCELRLATAVRRLGLNVMTLDPKRAARVVHEEYRRPILEPGLYHAVKRADHNETRLLHGVERRARRVLSLETRTALVSGLERAPWLARFVRKLRRK